MSADDDERGIVALARQRACRQRRASAGRSPASTSCSLDRSSVDRDSNTRAGRPARQQLRPPIISVSGPSDRRIQPWLPPRAGPLPVASARRRPFQASATSPRRDTRPARSSAYQSISAGRTPPISSRKRSGQRYDRAGSVVVRRARDRCAADRRRTRRGRRPPPFQYFTSSSHSCFGGAGEPLGKRRRIGAHPSERPPQVEVLPTMNAERPAAAGRARLGPHVGQHPKRRRVVACVRRERRMADRQRDASEASGAPTRPIGLIAARPADGEEGHRHHERQRVAGRDGLLKEQVEDQVRPKRRGERRGRARRFHQQPDRADDGAARAPPPPAATSPTGARKRVLERRDELARRRRRPEHRDARSDPRRPGTRQRLPVAARPAREQQQRHAPRSRRQSP